MFEYHGFAESPQILFLVTGEGAIGQFLTTDAWPLLSARTTADQCALVEEQLIRMEREARGPNLMDYEQALEAGLIRRFDPSWTYYEHLSTLVFRLFDVFSFVYAHWLISKNTTRSSTDRCVGHLKTLLRRI